MEMTTLRDELRRQPFEPFSLRLSDGSVMAVRHADFIAVAPPRTVFVVKEEGGYVTLDVQRIAAIDRSHAAKPRRLPKGRNAK